MSYLVDTNVLSELRRVGRADPKVVDWFRVVTQNVKHGAGTGARFVDALGTG